MTWTAIICLALAYIPFSILLASAIGRQMKTDNDDRYSVPLIREAPEGDFQFQYQLPSAAGSNHSVRVSSLNKSASQDVG